MKTKKVLLPLLFIIALLSSCAKNNYNCVCINTASGYATQTDTTIIKDTKNGAQKACKIRNYTSQTGDVKISCSIN